MVKVTGYKYYLVWCDYDGNTLEEFDELAGVSARVNELKTKGRELQYGVTVLAVYYGRQCEVVAEEKIVKWKVVG